MKKNTKKILTKNLDKLCSRIIRSKGVCEKCGLAQYEKLQCAHIYSRNFRSVRWDMDNLLCLCAGCHFMAHQKPLEFTEFVQEHLGKIKYIALKNRANAIKKWSVSEMQEYFQGLSDFFL